MMLKRGESLQDKCPNILSIKAFTASPTYATWPCHLKFCSMLA